MKALVKDLLNFTKRGDKTAFLQFIEKRKVLDVAPYLSPTEASKLIYAFSNFKIKDQKFWAQLENLFLNKEKNMSMHDLVTCAYSFAKYSKNNIICKQIEENINMNFLAIEVNKEISILCYAFCNAKYNSPKLWQRLEFKSLQLITKFNEREYAMIAWTFSKMDQGSSTFWKVLEQTLVPLIGRFELKNQAIVADRKSTRLNSSH